MAKRPAVPLRAGPIPHPSPPVLVLSTASLPQDSSGAPRDAVLGRRMLIDQQRVPFCRELVGTAGPPGARRPEPEADLSLHTARPLSRPPEPI